MEKKEKIILDEQSTKKDSSLEKAILNDEELGQIAGGAKIDLKTLVDTTVKILKK